MHRLYSISRLFFLPIALTSLMYALIAFAKISGFPPTISNPLAVSALITSGSASAIFADLLMRSTTACGVPAGATKPDHA